MRPDESALHAEPVHLNSQATCQNRPRNHKQRQIACELTRASAIIIESLSVILGRGGATGAGAGAGRSTGTLYPLAAHQAGEDSSAEPSDASGCENACCNGTAVAHALCSAKLGRPGLAHTLRGAWHV